MYPDAWPLPNGVCVALAASGRTADGPKTWQCVFEGGLVVPSKSWGWADPLNLSLITAIEPLVPYMSAGVLGVRLRITRIDGIQL